MITVIESLIIFSLVILVHEGGHFAAAKLSGVAVKEFSIGMGPLLLKTRRKGTQYSLRLLPVGGYVAMEGEDGADPDEDGEPDGGEDTPPSASDTASASETTPEEEAPQGIPFHEAKIRSRLLILAAGALMNFVLGFVILLAVVGMDDSIVTLRIYGFADGALCEQTGLQAEDTIYAINGRRCYVAEDVSYELSRTENYSADFTVIRDGEKVELDDVRFDTYVDEDGDIHMPTQITVYAERKTPLRVIRQAWNYEKYYARIVISSLIDLVRGRESINDLSGPVGIVSAIGEAAAIDWQTLFSLMALITVNLGVFNLLPLPALDGGKIFFLLLEAIFRKPVPTKIQEYTAIVGLLLLFGVMIFATYNDIIRLVSGG